MLITKIFKWFSNLKNNAGNSESFSRALNASATEISNIKEIEAAVSFEYKMQEPHVELGPT